MADQINNRPGRVSPIRVDLQSPDDYVFLLIQAPDRPSVTVDIRNVHSRRTLSVRINGMQIGSMLLDMKELPPVGDMIERFCPYCGKELNLVSSRTHICGVNDEYTTVEGILDRRAKVDP